MPDPAIAVNTARRDDPSSMRWTCQDVRAATGAAGPVPPDTVFSAISIDSRRIAPGDLFVALRGERHDGHEHVAAAREAGARAALVARVPEGVDPAACLIVGDPARALGDLAAFGRRRLAARVVGITGSNGKTTTKEMLAAIGERALPAGADSAPVLKTHGNQNNLIGLPLTLLRAAGDEALVVLEMGMNARGEIARLTEIADPDVGVITNVGAAHLEGLGSLDGVAEAKGELFAGMRRDATIVVNTEDERVTRLAARFPGPRIEVGPGRTVAAQAVRDFGLDGLAFDLHVDGTVHPVRLAVPGVHMVGNALLAAAAAHALGMPTDTIAEALATAAIPSMRMQVIRLGNGVTLVNDGYNANPTSTAAALRALGRHAGRRIAVLGEMRELGVDAPRLHAETGAAAADAGIDVLVAMGPAAPDMAGGARGAGLPADRVHVCADPVEAAAVVVTLWRRGDAVLAKGSRGADEEEAVRRSGSRMGEVVRLLRAAADGEEA